MLPGSGRLTIIELRVGVTSITAAISISMWLTQARIRRAKDQTFSIEIIIVEASEMSPPRLVSNHSSSIEVAERHGLITMEMASLICATRGPCRCNSAIDS